MKRLGILLLFMLLKSQVHCQDSLQQTSNIFFLKASSGVINTGFIGGVGFCFSLKKNIIIDIAYHKNNFDSELKPSDYYPASSLIGKPIGPQDVIQTYSLGVGKYVYSSKAFKILVIGGASYFSRRYNTFKPITPRQGWFGYSSNYEEIPNTNNGGGAYISASLQGTANRVLGIHISPMLQLQNNKIALGGELSILIGKLY